MGCRHFRVEHRLCRLERVQSSAGAEQRHCGQCRRRSRPCRLPGRGECKQRILSVSTDTQTAGLSALEYILFLLLLRISPPHHRSNPLALRLPHSAVQTPTPFAYSADALAHDGFASPAGPRYTSHRRYSSRHTLLQPSSLAQSNLFARQSDAEDEEEDDPTDDHEQGDLFDEDFSDTSSISESSIIDLPPPLSPSRIVPPPSLSVNRGLDILAGIEQSPVIGAVVRRTRSARFLARSWGSRNEDEENQEGYGTFGYAQGGRAGDHQL